MTKRSCLSIILAAGEGTRMKSAVPKVLHKIAGLPMLVHVVRAVRSTGADDVALVVGNGADTVLAAVEPHAPTIESHVQERRLGTAHAVLAARKAIARGYDDVLIVFGDHPLLEPAELAKAREKLAEGVAIAVLGFRPPVPGGYGRLIEKDGQLLAIREEKDCSEEERKIDFCNSGLMAISGDHALPLLDGVGNDNAKGEFYLTDIVEIANEKGLSVVAIEVGSESAHGINNRAELAEAEAIWQARRRREMMLAGVTLVAPETVFFSWDTQVGAETVIEPNVFFGPGVKIAEAAKIRAFCHIEGATVAHGCEVGPFARFRPGADLREKAKVGNFCEVKKATIEPGAKVNHLSYIGDAVVGAKANVGAGAITCNYDGYNKYLTEIGAGAFIGSNSSLIAPVKIGLNAYVASGSVITDDVPDDALAFGRARQTTKPDRARQLREKKVAAAKG
jgi:bifunctional UDP-N-acetylglucosamine pyrophosphorylase/glucosamine-1-phosphate N-acetyltransferase